MDITTTISIFSLVVSVIAIIVVIMGWWKQRNIYDIEIHDFVRDEDVRKGMNKVIRNKLRSGNYTILHLEKGKAEYHIALGKLKK